MDMLTIGKFISGYTLSCYLAHFIVAGVVNKLWSITNSDLRKQGFDNEYPFRSNPKVRFWQGFVERALYTSCVVLKVPEGIAVWLAFKAIMRFKVKGDDPHHIPGGSIYMIGTALNIAFGILGSFVVNWSVTLK